MALKDKVARAHDFIADLKRQKKNGILFVQELDTLLIDTSQFIRSSDQKIKIKTFEHLIYTLLRQQYVSTLNAYLERFMEFINDPASYKESRESYFYPLLEIYIRDPRIGGPGNVVTSAQDNKHFYGYLPSEGMYETSITRPYLFEGYLRRQLNELIKNHQPVVRIRPGPRKMPIHFAIEANEQDELESKMPIPIEKIDVQETNRIPLYFDVPKLGEIDEIAPVRKTEAIKIPSLEFVNNKFFNDPSFGERIENEHVKKRLQISEAETDGLVRKEKNKLLVRKEKNRLLADNIFAFDEILLGEILTEERDKKKELLSRKYIIEPLSLFNGDRVDYSLGRIRHYTKTPPKYFQNFVIFTNYQMYVDEFLKYSMSHILLRAVLLLRAVHGLGFLPSDDFQTISAKLKKDAFIVVPADKSDDRALTAGWLMEKINIGQPQVERADTTIAISQAELQGCIRCALRKVLGGGKSPGVTDATTMRNEEEIFLRVTRRIFARFLDKRVGEGVLAPKSPQMPAYHLVRDHCSGISMVNIGVGPSNAKTITDHIAVLRPHVFLMLGHCAGLRTTQQLGHYVLANGYLRLDGVLDAQIRRDSPIPPIPEIDAAIFKAFNEVTGSNYSPGGDRRMSPPIRTGTVATVMDRNWELNYPDENIWPIESTKCVGLDMESGTVAANGFRLAVPYGTFLCVSDRPLHGDLKLEGMADNFYRGAVGRHFEIAIRAVEKLCKRYAPHGIPTRKLRAPRQPPFQ